MDTVTMRDQRCSDKPQRPRGNTSGLNLPGPSPFPFLSQIFPSVAVTCGPTCTSPSSGHRQQTHSAGNPALLPRQPHLSNCPKLLPHSNTSSLAWHLAHYTDPCHSFKVGIEASSSKQSSFISPPSATLSQSVPSVSWFTLTLAPIPRMGQGEFSGKDTWDLDTVTGG